MGTFAAGQVVIVHFLFPDLTASKLRPAVVLAEAGRGDWILCQITSKSYGDEKAIPLDTPYFARGSLRLASHVRPGKAFHRAQQPRCKSSGELQPGSSPPCVNAVVRMIQKG